VKRLCVEHPVFAQDLTKRLLLLRSRLTISYTDPLPEALKRGGDSHRSDKGAQRHYGKTNCGVLSSHTFLDFANGS
jgi:hypothetical protein